MSHALVPQSEPVRTLGTATAKLKGEYVVDSVADLTNITALCAPGSIAYTPDLASIWMLAPDGTTWTAVA
jgi:hypothetical protein